MVSPKFKTNGSPSHEGLDLGGVGDNVLYISLPVLVLLQSFDAPPATCLSLPPNIFTHLYPLPGQFFLPSFYVSLLVFLSTFFIYDSNLEEM